MSYFGVSTRNGVGLGLGTVPSLTNTPLGYRLAPSLDLSFAGSDALSPAITFTRTTNATVTGSNGLIQNAPMNLLTFSEQFDNAAWVKTSSTITANAAVSPDGSTTADKLVATADNAQHVITNTVTTSNISFTLSVYAKAAEQDWLFVRINDAPNAARRSWFNLATGVVGTVGSNLTSTITDVGNGWYRCSTTVNSAFAGSQNILLGVSNADNTTNYTGDGTSGIYIWGAQLEARSTATTYNPTTVKNLLGFTENFDNAAWTKSNATITSGFTDIYGQPFAQRITATGANATVLSSYTAVASTPYTFSVYLQRVSGTGNVDISIDGTTWVTQALTTTLQRFSVTGSPTAGTKTPGIRIVASGDVVVAFGAQLSDSASVDPYVYQPVAAPASTAYYGPRFDYDPVTLQPKGLLIEEQRTNSLLASSILGSQVVVCGAVPYTLSFYGTGTVVLSGTHIATVVGLGAYPTRTTYTFTPTAGILVLTVTGSVEMAQLEAGSFATSYIPTVASQVTRAADSASIIGNNFARWYNVNEGTLYAECVAPAWTSGLGSAPGAVSINDGSANNRMYFGRSVSTTRPFFNVNTGGVTQADITTSTSSWLANTAMKLAGAYKFNDFALSTQGSAVGTDVVAIVPIVTQMQIGNRSDGSIWNAAISRIAYYNRRLANTELTALTS